MRIVIDMQGAQTDSRFRGIGRYTLAFAQAIVLNRGEHEIILVLSGLFPETIEPIRAAFEGLLPQENIRVWYAPGPVKEEQSGNETRREVAELLREAFIAGLQPDLLHITSLFEGYVDDAVTSIGHFEQNPPVSVTMYDLIPLLNPDKYLTPNPRYHSYYQRKIESLNKAQILLAISEYARQEAVSALKTDSSKITTISTAIENIFVSREIQESEKNALQQKLSINHPFILYTGGADERKNLPRLIRAYAALDTAVRQQHQLVFAGRMPEGDIENFKTIASQSGLKEQELIFTGYISDVELVALYNLCKLYVFPSWHEGFGLPALEAMACGAPVIGANTTSLPEVIGLDEALFDPFEEASITNKILEALQSNKFRLSLIEHGLKQAKQFSWNTTAQKAMQAWQMLASKRAKTSSLPAPSYSREHLLSLIKKRLENEPNSYLLDVSQCIAKNESNGIQRQLFLDISELHQNDAATGVQRVVRSYLKGLLESPPLGFKVEPIYATQEKGYHYARNFTQKFLGLEANQLKDNPIHWQRGDLFFGLDMQHHVQLAHFDFYQQLMNDGVVIKFLVYDLLPIQLADLFKDSNAKELHSQLMKMFASINGVICISKATADAYEAWIKDNNIAHLPNLSIDWVHIGGDIHSSKPSMGIPSDAKNILSLLKQRPTFLCVSTLEPRKKQDQILDAVEQLWGEGIDVNLVFVGQQGWKTESLIEKIESNKEINKRLFWLKGISDEYLEKIYAASSCLIAASINEGFGLSLIEAARFEIPIIARDIPVFREVAGDHAEYFSGNSGGDLASVLKDWLLKYKVGKHVASTGMPWSTWQQSTEKLKQELVVNNYPRRQLLVDISELVQRDAKSGIQRVVRNILREWLTNPPVGFKIEPVYATTQQGYRYARRFTLEFLGCPTDVLDDEPISYSAGDIFLGLDLQPEIVPAQKQVFQTMRQQGVTVKFVVYDLLLIQLPHCFPKNTDKCITNWLQVIAESDGALCISKAVADELEQWYQAHPSKRERLFAIDWFHLGADIETSNTSDKLPSEASKVLNAIAERPCFLMVGTLEPRKGHMQSLTAFEKVWADGGDTNLVIVGKQGWMVEELIEKLNNHPELNKRLFWLEGISDEYLEQVYAASSCLIAASEGEGFGLPLIEAAQHKLPIIARNIPVFREVAGGYAFYFDGKEPETLAEAIQEWLKRYENNSHPRSDEMPWLTWQESAKNLMDIV